MKESYIIDYQKLKKFIITIVAFIALLLLVFKSIYYFAPFIIALALSGIMEPLIRFLVNKVKLPRQIAAIISLILVLIVLGSIASNLVSKVIFEIKSLVDNYPYFIREVYSNIISLSDKSNAFFISLPTGLPEIIGRVVENTMTYVTGIFKSVLRGVFNTAISLPSALIFLIVTILSTFFISSGRNDITHAIRSKLPENWYNKLETIKNEVFTSLFKLIKAYLIIMSITFTELLIGFSAMKLRYAIILAFLVCIIDILPVLGTGTVLIPWSLYSLLTGDTKLAISLSLLYVVILIVRQMLEPKIIGHQIGVHPLITLMSIYLGLKLIGAAGLMLGPIIMLIIKNIIAVAYKDKSLTDLLFTKAKIED